MPSWCGVVGCSNNNSAGKQVRFYKLPAILDHLDSRTRNLSIERRAQWLASINSKDLRLGSCTKPSLRCLYAVIISSKVSPLKITTLQDVCVLAGGPAKLYDKLNPDWVPTQNMGHSEVTIPDMDRYDRLQAHRRHVNMHMRDDSAETDDPVPDGSILQIDGMLLFSGTSVAGTDYKSNANTSLQLTLERMLFVTLDAQWIMFHARRISQ